MTDEMICGINFNNNAACYLINLDHVSITLGKMIFIEKSVKYVNTDIHDPDVDG